MSNYLGPFRREADQGGGCPNPGCHEPEKAAEAAVKRVLAICGVDIDNPESVAEFQADLRFGKEVRKIIRRGIFGFVATIAALLGGYIMSKITGIAP